MGFAEVSLTFDNSDGVLPIDFSEVTVTRRVYRSGESEYMINKTRAVLRIYMSCSLIRNWQRRLFHNRTRKS